MRQTIRKEGGFTLAEVLITIFILGAVSISLISVFVYGFNLQMKTKQTTLATQVAQFEIERYRNMSFAAIGTDMTVSLPLGPTTRTFQTLFTNTGGESGPYNFMFKKDGANHLPYLVNGQETIVIQDGPAIGLDKFVKKITVTVVWDYRTRTIAGGNPMRKDVVSYFSEGGINR